MSRSALSGWLASFLPAPMAVRWRERLRSCVGALLGIVCAGSVTHLLFGPAADIPFLIAPMGASTVLLFGVPASPLAQPWSIVGGNLVAAVVGVSCAMLIPDPLLASALAVSLALGGMFVLRCVHPPSGAVALTAVLGGPAVHALGFRFVLEPVELQSLGLVLAALVYHTLTGHRYPHAFHSHAKDDAAAEPAPRPQNGFTRADVEAALERRGELLDVDLDDLDELLHDIEAHTDVRTGGDLHCADIVPHPAAAIPAGASVGVAWRLLKRHDVEALPVVNDAHRVVGLVTRTDLLDGRRRSGLLALPPRWLGHAAAPAARNVSALMQREVHSVASTLPVSDLIPLFAARDCRYVAVVDRERRLMGLLTPTDLVGALHERYGAGQKRAA